MKRKALFVAYLLFEAAEEFVEAAFERWFEDQFGNGADLASHFSAGVVGQIGAGGIVVEVYRAGCFDGTQRTLWLGDEHNMGGRGDFAGADEDVIRPFKARDSGSDDQFDLAFAAHGNIFGAVATWNTVFEYCRIKQGIEDFFTGCGYFLAA